jgi:hypothetical protein
MTIVQPPVDETVSSSTVSSSSAIRATPPPGSVFRFAGLSHAPRPVRPADALTDYGIAYFHQLLSQYQTFPLADSDPAACLHDNPQATEAIKTLIAKADTVILTWEDIDRLETALMRVLPEAALRSSAWSLRARYCEVAGAQLSDLYLKSKPMGWDDAAVSVELLRADVEMLLSEMQKYRMFLPARDRVRDQISRTAARWTLGTTLAGAAVWVGAHFVPIPHTISPALTMMLAMLAGSIGGFVSMQSRLQAANTRSLPLLDRIELETEQFSLYLSPISGAIFAAILYFLFMGHYLQGTLFPEVSEESLKLPVNFGGLIVWSFLAGFAERLVPDVLSRLVARSGATAEKTSAK